MHDGLNELQVTDDTFSLPRTLYVQAPNLIIPLLSMHSEHPSIFKATNDSGLKGGVCMLPWHAIPFLKALGMLTPNPCQNG